MLTTSMKFSAILKIFYVDDFFADEKMYKYKYSNFRLGFSKKLTCINGIEAGMREALWGVCGRAFLEGQFTKNHILRN